MTNPKRQSPKTAPPTHTLVHAPFFSPNPDHKIQKRTDRFFEPQPIQPFFAALTPLIQAKTASNPATSLSTDQADSKTGLPKNLRTGIENLANMDMSDVTVHYNSNKPSQIHAHAFAQGATIHLAAGQEQHLAHEAWHVVQQKQGRVQPTMQLKSRLSINNDAGLEKEADVMGAKALSMDVQKTTPLPKSTHSAWGQSAQQPIQSVWIVRSGARVWEPDPYVLQHGEQLYTSPLLRTEPSVIFDEGTKKTKIDEHGAAATHANAVKPPDHAALHQTREVQGQELRILAKRLSPADLQQATDELAALAQTLEGQAGESVPKKHEAKITKLADKAPIEAKQFRTVIKGQDELTEASATSTFFNNLDKPEVGAAPPTPPPQRKVLKQYAENALRVMSSMRAPTRAIVAPIEHGGKLVGQQHPPPHSEPKLEGGGSSHSYSDRARVEAQNQVFAELSSPTAPPNPVFLASILAAGVQTLSTMSHPPLAGNVPDFNPVNADARNEERERIKTQVNEIAKRLSIAVDETDQDRDETFRKVSTPASPYRPN